MAQILVNDVLVSLMELAPTSTISSLMRTCRHLYRSGPRYILGKGVIVEGERTLLSFLAFASAENDTRLKHLKELIFLAFHISYPAANALSAFLTRSLNSIVLEVLRIEDAEALLSAGSPPLSNAFAKLKTVKILALTGIGKHGASFLRSMESKLEDAHLTMLDESSAFDTDGADETQEEDDPDDRNGIRLLHVSQDTLISLTGNGLELLTELLYAEVYPRVQYLTLFGNDCPVTIAYVHAFPNVRVFRYNTAEEDLYIIGQDMEARTSFRSLNKMEQDLLNSPWKSLTTCQANLLDHFLLGMHCHVLELNILGNFMETEALRAVMMDTTPEYMRLQNFDVNIFTRSLVSTMKNPYAQQLR